MNFYITSHLCINYVIILIEKKITIAFMLLMLRNYVKYNVSYKKKQLKHVQ